jgi:hypothetical protein
MLPQHTLGILYLYFQFARLVDWEVGTTVECAVGGKKDGRPEGIALGISGSLVGLFVSNVEGVAVGFTVAFVDGNAVG